MKKLSLLLVLPLVFLLFWCGEDETNILETNFDYDVEVCDKFFEVAECIINNTEDASWTQERKDDFKNEIKKKQEEWKSLSRDQLELECSSRLSIFWDDLDELWCQID